MKRDTRRAYRARTAATERSVNEATAEVKAAINAAALKASADYAKRTAPVPFTDTIYGWHRVIRVNAKTVTISGDFGDYRVPTKTIQEVRA